MITIQDWWKDLQGLTFEEGQNLAKSNNMVIRAKMIDGKIMMVTADFRRDRLNVSLKNGVIAGTMQVG